jgi:tetratricopeptide (TPR) repeat protein
MEPQKRQHLQDIYATDHNDRDDYTPQVSNAVAGERKRELRRHQFAGFIMGATILLLAVALVYLVVREYIDILKQSEAPAPITNEYIPRYSLPTESQWVLDFSRNYADPQWNGEGERPFNTGWLKKATFNVILAEQAMEIGEFAEAAKYYENALEILPDLEGVRIPLSMSYFKLKEYDKAIALLENASDTDLTYDVLNNLGAACIEAKVYDRAEGYLTRSIELKPAYPEGLKNLAMLYRKTDQEDKSIDLYEQYLDLRPQDTDTRHSFALYLSKVGNWELAGEQLSILTQEIKDDATLYLLLAQVEMKLGNDKAAIGAFQRASQLSDPKRALGWMNETEFDALRGDEDFQALMQQVEAR